MTATSQRICKHKGHSTEENLARHYYQLWKDLSEAPPQGSKFIRLKNGTHVKIFANNDNTVTYQIVKYGLVNKNENKIQLDVSLKHKSAIWIYDNFELLGIEFTWNIN